MIAAWMLYAVAVSLLITGAAWLAELALRRVRLPVRGVWLGAIALSLGLSAWPLARPLLPEPAATATAEAAGAAGAAGVPVIALDPIAFAVHEQGLLARLDAPLAAGWVLLSGMALLVLAAGALALRARRRRWVERRVEGADVLVAPDFGPAVVGLRRSRVVLPDWVVEELEAGARRLILLHEEEHRRAGDVRALGVAALAVVALPWNPAGWLQLRRLRAAVEMDCDRRVLRRGAPALPYARLLLHVSERTLAAPGPLAHPVAALAEPARTLERRLTMIVDGTKKRARWPAVALLGGALLLVGVACETPMPTEVQANDAPPTVEQTVEANAKAMGLDEDPLVYVDGVRVGRGVADAVDPQDIASIEVVKGSAAVGRWGSEAAGGVILIRTKAGEARAAGDVTSEASPQEPAFTPYTVAPRLSNVSAVREALVDEYPPMLRDAGIGGKAVVFLYIDEDGEVRSVRLDEPSGHAALDAAALEVARGMEFQPAMNRDKRVPVWISLPITFGAAGAAPADAERDLRLQIRGSGSISALDAVGDAVFLVDGDEWAQERVTAELRPGDIARVEVVKGPAAGRADGRAVIRISTKN